MNRSIIKIINENNISQIYISNALNNTKDTFLRNVNYCNYKDKFKNTLFIGMYTMNDFKYVKSHKANRYILWSDNNIKLTNTIITCINNS